MGPNDDSTVGPDEVAQHSQDSDSTEDNTMSRRQVLAVGSVAAMTLILGGCKPQKEGQEPTTSIGDVVTQPDSPPEFLEPDCVSVPNLPDLQVNMNDNVPIRYFDPTTGNLETRTITTRTYNGKVPGPTYCIKRGQKMEFKVMNGLPQNTYPAKFYEDNTPDRKTCKEYAEREIPHCFNTTDLHTHGLHVSPTTKEDPDRFNGISSDDVLVRIPPKNDTWDDPQWPSERRYCIWLPEFHAPGTHWYHAHVHGSTAIQVVDGMAGAMIVEEEEDEKIKDGDAEIEEKVWIIQEIAGVENGDVTDTQVYANLRDSEFNDVQPFGDGRPSVRFTVNSLAGSTLKMKTNEIQRWRFINATGTPHGFMDIAITEPDPTEPGKKPGPFVAGAMVLIAEDGITFYGQQPKVVMEPGHFLAPAYRADFLVQLPKKLPEGKKYEIWKRKVTNRSIRGAGSGPTQDELLALIDLEGPDGEAKPWPPLPSRDKAPCYLKPITENINPENMREFIFDVGRPGKFGGFTINGKSYSQSADVEVDLGSVEEWTLKNTSNSAHPIHIHVNPFQVVELFDPNKMTEPEKFGPEEAIWKDTIVVPPGRDENNVIVPGHVKFRTRFLTYFGTYVMHCHILIHEDVGMMVNVTVKNKDDKGQPPCQQVTECKLML